MQQFSQILGQALSILQNGKSFTCNRSLIPQIFTLIFIHNYFSQHFFVLLFWILISCRFWGATALTTHLEGRRKGDWSLCFGNGLPSVITERIFFCLETKLPRKELRGSMRKTRNLENRDYGIKTVLILNIIKIWWRKKDLWKCLNWWIWFCLF